MENHQQIWVILEKLLKTLLLAEVAVIGFFVEQGIDADLFYLGIFLLSLTAIIYMVAQVKAERRRLFTLNPNDSWIDRLLFVMRLLVGGAGVLYLMWFFWKFLPL